jgi:hypothetical protein
VRFGQAGTRLIQTFLAGYLVQTLLFDKAIPTDALMISSILGLSPSRCWAGCPIKWASSAVHYSEYLGHYSGVPDAVDHRR